MDITLLECPTWGEKQKKGDKRVLLDVIQAVKAEKSNHKGRVLVMSRLFTHQSVFLHSVSTCIQCQSFSTNNQYCGHVGVMNNLIINNIDKFQSSNWYKNMFNSFGFIPKVMSF